MFLRVLSCVAYMLVLGHAAPNNFTVKSADNVKDGSPTVTIPQGTMLGTHKKSYDGRTYSSFEGIPFAKPPVGDLRFEEPQPAEKWNDILVANKNYMCLTLMTLPMLKGALGTEDCLYAYVYVPREKINPEENLEVVVHIHGGAFMLGSPQFAAGPGFIIDKDVVFVTFNYRLGLLGFLSTEDDVVPGNNGLKDQSLALKWIKENIKYFGGNPDAITLTGLSAGAASVHYHYLSPLSKGLFHKGISHSGTALHCWALIKNPLKTVQIISKNISCQSDSTKKMIECLKGKEGNDVMEAVKSIFIYYDSVPFVPFGPVIEKGGKNPFISDHPYRLMEKGEVYDVPWITSNTINEGIIPTGFIVMLNILEDLNKNWTDLMYYAMDLYDTVDIANKQYITDEVRKFYFNNEPVTLDNIYNLVDLFSHRLYTLDTENALRLHAKATKSPVYYYLFGYILQMPSLFEGLMKQGVGHGDDGRLLYQIIGTPSKLPENDEKMMRLLTNFIEKFAKTGVPSLSNTEWLKVNPLKQQIDCLYIGGPENITMKVLKELGPQNFWKNFPIKEMENYTI